VIAVQLKEDLAQMITGWKTETLDRHGHWLSIANSQGWWLIKVDPLPTTDTRP